MRKVTLDGGPLDGRTVSPTPLPRSSTTLLTAAGTTSTVAGTPTLSSS